MPIKKITLALMLFSFAAIASAQTKAAITVSNTLPIAREEIIEISWNKIKQLYPVIDTEIFRVINIKTKKEYSYQLEYKGTLEVQNLLVQIYLAPKASIGLQILAGKPKVFLPKTYCRYVPERKDDFAWENDKIAFRMYGKALENTPKEMAYGVDVWVKNTTRLVLNERYKRGEYHINHGDGLDYYHVGLTLGAGGMAPYMNDTIWYSKNYRNWKILDNGPLRCSFQLIYDEWLVAGINAKAIKTITLDAGSQLNKVEAAYTFGENKSLPVVGGIIKRNEAGEMLLNEKDGILAYWEPQHGVDGTTAVACIFTTPTPRMKVTKEHLLSETTTDKNGVITYYQGAAWDKANDIKSAKEWFEYLQKFKQMKGNPLIINIKTL